MIIIKGISVVPIYPTWWKLKVLYNNTDNMHTQRCSYTQIYGWEIDTAVKKKKKKRWFKKRW